MAEDNKSQTTVAVNKEQGDKTDRFAPPYSFSPTGAWINRVFIVGTRDRDR